MLYTAAIIISRYADKQAAIHAALCDSLDTPSVMRHLKELIYQCNIYLDQGHSNTRLLGTITNYVTSLLRMFGVFGQQVESAQQDLVNLSNTFYLKDC